MIFLRGIRCNLCHLMPFVVEFGLNLGQLVNKSRSLVCVGKYACPRHRSITNLLGIGLGSFPFNYLGVPIVQGHPLRSYFEDIEDKVKCKLSA